MRCDVVNTPAYRVSNNLAVLTHRFFCPAERSSKILVIAELKGVIFHKSILIQTVSGLLLSNRLKDSGNYTYHTTSKLRKSALFPQNVLAFYIIMIIRNESFPKQN